MEKPRLFFIDNLRIMLITPVVTVLLPVTYGGFGSWYYKKREGPTHHTIQKAIDASKPGDVILVKDGVYDEAVEFPKGRVFGREGARLIVRAENPHGARVRRFTVGADWITIEGFDVTNAMGGLRNYGISVSGCRNEILGNYIHEIEGGVGLYVAGEGNVVRGNRIYACNKGGWIGGKDNIIEGNEIERLIWKEQDADYFRFVGERNVFRGNLLHGTRQDEIARSHVDGWQTFAVNRGTGEWFKDIVIEGNILMDFFHQGLMMSGRADWEGRTYSGDGLILRNNVFAGGGHIMMAHGIRNVQAYNNTFIRMGGSGLLFRAESRTDGTTTTGMVKNNIFLDCNGIYGAEKGCEMESAANLIFSRAKQYRPIEGRKDILNQDPLLADPDKILGHDGRPFTADDGYLLKPTSPALDRGVVIEGYAAPGDIFGTSRPRGTGWDIGAHEFTPKR